MSGSVAGYFCGSGDEKQVPPFARDDIPSVFQPSTLINFLQGHLCFHKVVCRSNDGALECAATKSNSEVRRGEPSGIGL